MKKHKNYDLWMHDDSELSSLLGSTIIQRHTIHEWPNSCVQKITLKEGKSLIYKYQSGGMIESSFYEQASSLILPETRTLWEDSWYSCMVIEYFDTPTFGQPDIPESELLIISAELLEAISKIKGDFPVLLDISSYSKWADMAGETLLRLRGLIENRRQYGSGIKDIEFMEKKVISPSIKSYFRSKTGLIHGDLNGGNIFHRDGGLKLIDWQSCKLAPIELDQASFLSRQGIDPSRYVSPEAAYMLYFVGIWWLVQCQTTLIPDGNFDERITYFISRIKEVIDRNS
ncbi:MAG: phosphotransferase [Deltaproteobacteria bacterium]|nr:phosphotransferase [Deltaproteobacteria bacterium]